MVARGMIGDGGGEERAADCTKCTKDDVGRAGGEVEGDMKAGLPALEPELFLLAGVRVAKMRPGDAKAVRARAETAIAERKAARP